MPSSKVFLSPAFALSLALTAALAPAACSHAEPTLQGFDAPGAGGEAGEGGDAGGSGGSGGTSGTSGTSGASGASAGGTGQAGQGGQAGKGAGGSGGNQSGGSSAGGQAGSGGSGGNQAGASGGSGAAGGPPVCTSGQQIACACPGTQVNGVQVCKEDGTGFGACTGCPGGQGGSSAQGGSSTAGTGGSSSPGGSSSQGGSGGTGGSNPFGGGGSSGSGGSSPTTCGGCQAEANQTTCSSPASLCSKDADCVAVNSCINACAPNDQSCANACTAAHEKGTNMLLAVQVCGCETGCSSLCDFCPGASPQNGSCVHSVCKTGPALKPACSPCVAAVCQQDSYCCDAASGAWDITCVLKLDASCGCYDPYSACLAKKVWNHVDSPDCNSCLGALCSKETDILVMSCDLQAVASQCKASCGDDAACACSCQHGQSGNCGDAIAIFDTCAANNCAQACR